VAQYAPDSRALTDLLFLDGMEADPLGQVSLAFDFGDLDELVVRVTTVVSWPSIRKLWGSALTKAILGAWIKPTWVRWAATMTWPCCETRR